LILCSGNLRIRRCDFGHPSTPVEINVVLFKISVGGKLEVDEISLTYTKFHSGIIKVEGKFILNDATFNHIELSSISLIMMECGDVMMKRCVFSDISLINGNGSIINSKIKTTGDNLNIIGI
jgi:hypothetical protein